MGYYHVRRTLKGVILKKFDLSILSDTIPDTWIPDESWVVQRYPKADGSKYDEMTKTTKLIFLGCLEDMPYFYDGPRTISEIDEETAQKIIADTDYRKYALLPALAMIFCYINHYPSNAFECLSDYDHTWMFVCSVQFPPESFNEKLSKLTESIMASEVSSFLTKVTREHYEPEIEWCEEYIKE